MPDPFTSVFIRSQAALPEKNKKKFSKRTEPNIGKLPGPPPDRSLGDKSVFAIRTQEVIENNTKRILPPPVNPAARGGTRVGPRRHDLVRERGVRRKSTRVICDDEQRSCRAKSCLPKGLRRRPAPASSRLLSDVPRRLRRHSSPASGRRSQRGPREFRHGLLARRV